MASLLSAVIYVNSDVVDPIIAYLAKQLLVSDGYVLDGYAFDGYVAQDAYFANNKRIIVKRDFWTLTDRSKADVVIHIKHGMATIEKRGVGPPGLTIPITQLTLYHLMNYPLRR